VTIAKAPEMKEQFERNGAEPITSASAKELSDLVKTETTKYAPSCPFRCWWPA